MDEPSDGITEAGEETLRSMLTSAARAGEHISRRREATKRAAAEKDSQTAREMQSRLEAEKQLGQAQLDKTHDSQWWEQAQPAEVAEAYQNARAFEPEDPAAAEAAEHMRQQVRERYDVDLSNFSDAEPDRFQRPPRTEEQMAEQERQGRAKAAEAEALMDASDHAEREAGAGKAPDSPEGIEVRPDGSTFYDSGWRRERFAEDLDERGIDQNAINARMQGDISQGKPAAESVANAGGRAPRARKGRPGASRGNQHSLER